MLNLCNKPITGTTLTHNREKEPYIERVKVDKYKLPFGYKCNINKLCIDEYVDEAYIDETNNG